MAADPEQQQQLEQLRNQIQDSGAHMFVTHSYVHQRFDEKQDRFVDLNPPIGTVRIGIISDEEYLALYASKHAKALRENIWGEAIQEFNDRMSKGPGDTGVCIKGKPEDILELTAEAFDAWQSQMAALGNTALYGIQPDGLGTLTPNPAAEGPWTLTLRSAEGTVFEHTYRHLGSLTIR